MTTPQKNLEITAAQLRQAIAEGAHARAGKLLVEYRQQLEAALAELRAGGRTDAELERQTQALLGWARQVVLASRATTATRLKRLARPVQAYRAGSARPRRTWELTA